MEELKTNTRRLHLFEGYGVELEYMIVNRETLDVMPVADKVLHHVAGEYVSEVERGDIAWSNELVNHVIEFKTNGPAESLEGLSEKFHAAVCEVNEILLPLGGMLMPTAMHPWMNPDCETQLWPHEYSAIYESYDRIFSCKGHGWSNVQSTHINLPFATDEEFGRLHAAIRLVLPLLPAIAASSPIVQGTATGLLDNRLYYYARNQARIPSISGNVIPECVYTERQYHDLILKRIWTDIAPFDPEGILREEFLNSRGAIARFGRGTIEIRVLDIQECPAADLAIIEAATALIRSLVEEEFLSYSEQKRLGTESLKAAYDEALANGLDGNTGREYGRTMSFSAGVDSFHDLWRDLLDNSGLVPEWKETVLQILVGSRGNNLSHRILDRVAPGLMDTREKTILARERIEPAYRDLCACLAENKPFRR